jgi:hypothetical protein
MSKKEKLTHEPAPAGQPAGPDEIDLGAALPTKPRRGRPRTATPKPPKDPNRKVRKDKGIKKTKNQTPYIDNNILIGDKVIKGDVIDYSNREDYQSAEDLKGKPTLNELKFLSLWLSGNVSRIKAMKSAGFKGANDSYLYLLAKKILEKYESQVEDHRILFRAMGAGETFVAKGLIKLAKESKSDMVKLNAYAQIAKILGLTKEQLEGAGGITLIFESQETGRVQVVGPGAPPPPPGPPGQARLPSLTSTKPMMITK